MSSVDALNNSSQPSGQARSPTQLGQNEFLKLMITQLKNQDPFKPLDPSEFLSQLAQFSTVTGIESMDGSLTELTGALRSSQVLGGAALIGRDVLAPATNARLAAGGTVHGAVEVPEGITDAQVRVRDSSGELIRSFQIEPQSGLAEFSWDGRTSSGDEAAPGIYRIEIIANVGGEPVSLAPLLTSRVDSVTMNPRTNELTLNTNIGALALSDVRRVM